MSLQTKESYEFADFRLDLSEKLLLRDGKSIPLTPKVFDTLQVLVENAGRLLEKDELMERIWQGRVVEESNLTFNIKMLRRALGDDAARPRFIETVPRRGYRFIAEVREAITEAAPQTPVPSRSLQGSWAGSFRFKKLLLPAGAVFVLGIILTGVWYARSKNAPDDAPVLFAPFDSEKVSTNGKVFQAVISSDGKKMIYMTEISGKRGVWLKELESNNNIEIIPASDDLYYGLALSPDAQSLYFERRPKGVKTEPDIYRVSIFGGIPTRIVSGTQGSFSISADGERIVFRRHRYQNDENWSLWIADTANGKNETKLTSRPAPAKISDSLLSLDGRSVVFAAGQSANAGQEFSLFEVNLESGRERALTPEKFFIISSLAWLPGRNGLLFTAQKNAERNSRIWHLSIESGQVEPLTKDSETYVGLSLDQDARVVVSTQVKPEFHLSLLPTDNSAGRRVLTDAITAAFAPDGKIVFSSTLSGNKEIWSINPDGSERRQLSNDGANKSDPLFSPADASIFFSSNRSGEYQVWRMNADGSNQTQITQIEGGFPRFVSADGRWLYYSSALHKTLWRVSTNGGQEQQVLNRGQDYFAGSPSGSEVAFFEKRDAESVVTIVSLADGQIVKVFRLAEGKANPVDLVWSRDGKNLAYVVADAEYENNTIWLQSLDTKSPRRIADLGDANVRSFALSPDGKSFAVVQGGWRHDAVLLRGLK